MNQGEVKITPSLDCDHLKQRGSLPSSFLLAIVSERPSNGWALQHVMHCEESAITCQIFINACLDIEIHYYYKHIRPSVCSEEFVLQMLPSIPILLYIMSNLYICPEITLGCVCKIASGVELYSNVFARSLAAALFFKHTPLFVLLW